MHWMFEWRVWLGDSRVGGWAASCKFTERVQWIFLDMANAGLFRHKFVYHFETLKICDDSFRLHHFGVNDFEEQTHGIVNQWMARWWLRRFTRRCVMACLDDTENHKANPKTKLPNDVWSVSLILLLGTQLQHFFGIEVPRFVQILGLPEGTQANNWLVVYYSRWMPGNIRFHKGFLGHQNIHFNQQFIMDNINHQWFIDWTSMILQHVLSYLSQSYARNSGKNREKTTLDLMV